MKKTVSIILNFIAILASALVSTATADQEPAIAYDSFTREYLSVYTDNADIRGRLVYENGGKDKDLIIEMTSSSDQFNPAVAFALDNNIASNSIYLVVWEDGNTNQNILGRTVSRSGAPGTGSPITISSAAGSQTNPSITYDNINERFLVVWTDNSGTDNDIYGQLVEKTGVLHGPPIIISSAVDEQTSPSAAFTVQTDIDSQAKIDNALKIFLVVWEDQRNGNSDIYGQIVNADGTLKDANFVISNDSSEQTNPSMAYSKSNDINGAVKQFLVVWEDDRNGDADIYGQLYDAKNEVLLSTSFLISKDTSDQRAPSVAYSSRSSSERFLAVWQDDRSFSTRSSDIYGQFIDPGGVLSGANFSVPNPNDSATSAIEQTPAVAFSDYCDNFLVAFIRSGLITFEAEGSCLILSDNSSGPGSGLDGGSGVSGGASAGGGGCFVESVTRE